MGARRSRRPDQCIPGDRGPVLRPVLGHAECGSNFLCPSAHWLGETLAAKKNDSRSKARGTAIRDLKRLEASSRKKACAACLWRDRRS